MAEAERVRVRERGTQDVDSYELVMRYRKELTERNLHGPIVVKASDRKVALSRQGRVKVMLEPMVYKDVPLQTWRVFTHEIRTKSGKHRHQGGLVIYVLEGKGYSIVDEERKDWEKGDLILLPMKPDGVTHQHFNLNGPENPAVWAAFIYIPVIEHVASDLEQKEPSPEFTAAN
jgi:quercetin dioxygenase-like cupin family protein